MRYSSEKKQCSPPKMVPIYTESHFLSKLIRRITALPWRHNICFVENVSFRVSLWEFLSFTLEWIFVFKLIVLHKRLTLLVWIITFKSILAEKVFVLFYWEESYAFTGFCWVIERIDFPLTQWITRKESHFIWFYFFNIQSHNIKLTHIHNVCIKLSMNNYVNIHH